MERGNNSYGQETTMQDRWVKIGVLGCNSVIPRNVGEPPTGDGTAVGNAANAATADSLAVGDGAAAHGQKSVAIGNGSVASNDNECSVGKSATKSAAEYTREVTHVSEPTAPTSAANKNYVDTTTSNALIENVFDMRQGLVTVDDACTQAPISLMFNGVSRQDGTPSVSKPVEVQVVTAPIIKVSGADQGKAESVAITLPDEHPYLASTPDGTADQVKIDTYGNVTLTATVGKTTTATTDGITATVGTDALSSTGTLADGATVYYNLTLCKNYSLGKVDLPALKKGVSKVWVDGGMGGAVFMTYKRDINTLLDRDKLPIASTTNRGTVKVGYGLDVSADGTMWVTESDSIPLAQTVTVRTSEKNFAVTGSSADVASHNAVMPVFNCGGYYNTFGGYFYLNLANSYKAGTKIHIELDVVWQETHICSSIHRVAVVAIQNDTYTIPFGPSMYQDADYNWYYWSFDVPVTADVPAKAQIHVNVF